MSGAGRAAAGPSANLTYDTWLLIGPHAWARVYGAARSLHAARVRIVIGYRVLGQFLG